MKFLIKTFTAIVAIIVAFSPLAGNYTFAQASSPLALQDAGLRIGYNQQTGKVSFIGADPSKPITVRSAQVQGLSSEDRALAMVQFYAQDFGLKNAYTDLSLKSTQSESNRQITKYRQIYQGVPVMGGEMIVNANDTGGLLSLNGEISPDLNVDANPVVSAEQAQGTALQVVAKWNNASSEDFTATQPQLWIYDPRLLGPEPGTVSLVWRMDVTFADSSTPMRELVLIDAHRGNVALHFNQDDIAWHGQVGQSNGTSLHSISPNTNLSSGSQTNVNVLTTNTWYVKTSGNDSNSCTSASSPCRTINKAIAKSTNGGTIKVASGTYTGAGTEVVLINKNVTLTGGWNSSFTVQNGTSTIDGQNARRGVSAGGTVILDHFAVVKGQVTSDGGGIYNGGNLTITNSLIESNVAVHGGGVFNTYTNGTSSLTLSNTTIRNNSASNDGGGIYNHDSLAVLILNNSTLNNNSAYFAGGGIYNQGSLTLNNSTLSSNSASSGGGIDNYSGTLVLINTTVSNNVVSSQGGGLHSFGGSASLKNSILSGNTTAGFGPDCYGTIVSTGYNLLGNNGDCVFTSTTGDLVGTTPSPINPRLGSLQDNGGPTFTQALMEGSPAIDAGSPATPGSGGSACLSTDQRGVTRPVGTRCDMGAYEGSIAWVPTALANTYTANHTTSLPGTFLCNQNQTNCTNNANPDADAAHRYAIGTYNFYASQHNRNSIDNQGMVITSTVQYDVNYDNAFWNGSQMIYGDAHGFALADDVVAHELTHGVTQYESNLFYYYQSGAINESLSDVWGELYDQSNGLGNDAANVKWQIGEDVSGLGAMRSMKNPPAYGDPDMMTSGHYYIGANDNGGVHTNSGVNNKAAYLMVDGDSFNGKTVTALGADKTLAIYYEVQTNLLTSGADYSDLYYALQQACLNLLGQKGITSNDCVEVKDAVDAVEMNLQPTANFNTDAPYCDSGNPVSTVFSDDLESGTGNWTFTNGTYTRWQYDSPYGPYAHSGAHFLFADDYPGTITDANAKLISLTIPSHAYLHFAHAYDFETSGNYYDGGVLEYSTNGGASWVDAGSLIDFNGYKGTIYNGSGNPLAGRSGFVGSSHGYISTRLNLASLAGNTVTFRWRMGLDSSGYSLGWWVDDVKVYQCQSEPVGLGMYDDTDAHWSYSGNWTAYTGSGPANNTMHYTSTAGNYAELMFSGTKFTLTFTKYSNRGSIDVYVDGSKVTTISAYSSSLQWQQTYTSPSYADGAHTVRLLHAGGGTYIDIDAIEILP